MPRSKLEWYINILKVLSQCGPLKPTHILYKANLNSNVTNQCLSFLIQQNLIEKRSVSKERVMYAITQQGIIVLKRFRELEPDLLKENSRRMRAVL